MDQPKDLAHFRLTSAIAEKRIRHISETTSCVVLTTHARQRMVLRDITATELYRILRFGEVVGIPTLNKHGDWKCKIVFRLRGRRTAGAVVALDGRKGLVVVITVEWEDGK
ncbi:MAG: DUF4258 domain-containing protein [Rudaea sp.]